MTFLIPILNTSNHTTTNFTGFYLPVRSPSTNTVTVRSMGLARKYRRRQARSKQLRLRHS